MNAPQPGTGVWLDRIREYTALALHEGASLAQILAQVIAVHRHGTRPTSVDHIDAVEVAEHAEVLSGFRATPPGEMADPSEARRG